MSLSAPSSAMGKWMPRPRKRKSCAVEDGFASCSHSASRVPQNLFDLARECGQLVDEVHVLSASVIVPRTCARCSAKRKSAVSWAVKALVEATPISGPAWV